jgi:hypothetical protein
VQVFAQMYLLEPGNSTLLPFLKMDHFFPRKMAITIRHRKLSFMSPLLTHRVYHSVMPRED